MMERMARKKKTPKLVIRDDGVNLCNDILEYIIKGSQGSQGSQGSHDNQDVNDIQAIMACTNTHFRDFVKGISKTPVHRLRGKRVLGKVKHECTMLYNEDVITYVPPGNDDDISYAAEPLPNERYVKVTSAKNNASFELRFKFDSRRADEEYVHVCGMRYGTFFRNLPGRLGPKGGIVVPVYKLMQKPEEVFKYFSEPNRKFMNKIICNMKTKIQHGVVTDV
jgi:hypothetical protein